MTATTDINALLNEQDQINTRLSKRFIELDPSGYFLIYVDREKTLICADHYTNSINKKGLAVDPDSGEVIACQGGKKRTPTQKFSAKTAKELCIQLFETDTVNLVTKLDHAAYLGREFIKAEIALAHNSQYIQD